MPNPPLVVQEFTPEIAIEVREIARALPYRSELGVDPDRVYWVDVSGRERIGIAFTGDAPDGPWWMIAFSLPGDRRVSRSRVRQVVDLIAGRGTAYEPAPLLEGGPPMTMVRARAG